MGVAAMPAVAGCSGSSSTPTDSATDTETPTETETETMQPTATPQQTEQESIDPRFGYVLTGDDSPPVEPDHTVNLLIRPRENIPIPEFYFEPTGLAVDVGDTVLFNLPTPHHNVNAYHPAFGYTQRVPQEVPPYSSPILGAGEGWLYTFQTEGVHNIMCAPHELFGMVGSVVVGSPTGPGANPVGEAPAPSPQSRPPEFTAGLVLSDPAMTPENIAEQGSVSWDDLAPESKRPLLQPVQEE
jgi:plastocyanin